MSVNKAILLGNAGKDPEVRYLENGIAVASITLATTERGYTTKTGIEVPAKTEWHNIVAWRGLAEIAEKYIKKGTPLYIEGKITTRKWEKDGVTRYTTEIVAESIELLGKPTQKEEPGPTPSNAAQKPDFLNSDDGGDDLPF